MDAAKLADRSDKLLCFGGGNELGRVDALSQQTQIVKFKLPGK